MSLKTPSFWYREPGSVAPLREMLFGPVSTLYQMAFALHQASVQPFHASMPVVCIGNIVAGGTGKTPTSIALMQLIREHGLAKTPHFMLRGYGGAEMGPLLVDLSKHNSWDVGDEALILAQHAPTIIAADRKAGAELAQEQGADLILMDDGLQNPGIHKDLKLIVINGEMGFGNEKMIPAGPLRQPLKQGLQKADGFIFIGEDVRNARKILPASKPIFQAQLHTAPENLPDQDTPYIAFAGLGYPQKFFGYLKNSLNLNILESVAFDDHHPYTLEDFEKLRALAAQKTAQLLTTQKDYTRLPESVRSEVQIVPVEMRFAKAEELLGLIKSVS